MQILELSMPSLLPPEEMRADAGADIVIIGAGACGLTASLAVATHAGPGRSVLVLERDATPTGSTSLASGFIPAAGTRFQRAQGIMDDTPALLAADIKAKAKHRNAPDEADLVAGAIGPALEFLAQSHGIPFEVLEGFRYPGHSRLRMHAVPEHTGTALMARLMAAADQAGVEIATQAAAETLFADSTGRIHGVRILRPDGASEDIACAALMLACNGYGGNPALVAEHIPQMAGALYFGHTGNRGDALRFGEALAADIRDLSAYQGHGSVAHPHGVLITWALMMEGGIQVNTLGRRFWNETEGYSEAATAVLAQPDGIAWNIYDARLHELGLQFEDYRTAVAAGAIRSADHAAGLAEITGLAESALAGSIAQTWQKAPDQFGRSFTTPLAAPYYAVRVTGTLFHTQGGLRVDAHARVLRRDGSVLPNLYAGGGAARGVSGPEVWGYLSGNGLLTAIAHGWLAGRHAAQ